MTGAQLLYCYDQNFGCYDIEFLKLVARVIARQNGLSIERATNIAIWRMVLIDRHGKIQLHIPIKPPKHRRITWRASLSTDESKPC